MNAPATANRADEMTFKVVHAVAHRMPYAFTPRLTARLIADRQARSRPCS